MASQGKWIYWIVCLSVVVVFTFFTSASQPAVAEELTGSVSGWITLPGGAPAVGIALYADDGEGYTSPSTCSAADGSYLLEELPLNRPLTVVANPLSSGGYGCPVVPGYAVRWWNDQPNRDAADFFTLTNAVPTRGDINFSLPPGGGVSGHIYLADGVTPVDGVCLAFYPQAHGGSPANHWGHTGQDGSFTIWGLALEPVYIQVNPQCLGMNPNLVNEWYAPGSSVFKEQDAGAVTITAGELQTGIDFQLNEGGRISGRVMDSQGNGLPGIGVMLDSPSQGVGACTLADGSYVFPNVEFDVAWHIRANSYDSDWCSGMTPYAYQFWDHKMTRQEWETVTVTEANPSRDGIDFNLGPGGGIRGHIYEQDGVTPVVDACLRFSTTPNFDFIEGWWNGTGADGAFTIPHLPAGPLYIQSDKGCHGSNTGLVDEWYAPGGSGNHDQAQPVMITAGTIQESIDFQLDPSGSISGQVTNTSGAPLGNILVTIENLIGFNACTDQAGRFSLGSVPLNFPVILMASPNDWNICGSSIDFVEQYWNNKPNRDQADPITLTLAVRDKDDANFVLAQSSTIRGHVYLQDGVTPVADVCVETMAPNFWTGTGFSSTTEADGSYVIQGLQQGSYYIRAGANCGGGHPFLMDEWYAPGGSVTAGDQAVLLATVAGQVADGIDFQLDAAGAIAGHVFKADGLTPIEGMEIIVTDLNDNWINSSSSDAQGFYQVSSLEVRQYKVFARDPAQPPQYTSVFYNQKGDSLTADLVNVTVEHVTPGVDFSLQSTQQEVITSAGGELTGVTEQGVQVKITVPPGAVNEDTSLVFGPVLPMMGAKGFTFNLDAYVQESHQAGFQFILPVVIRLDYTEAQLGSKNEKHLRLFTWNAARQKWEDAACGPYIRHPEHNWLSVPVCHLSSFNWIDQPHQVMLPFIGR